MLEEKLGEIGAHLRTKKRVKKVGAREVVQCLKDNCFLGLDVDVAHACCPVVCHKVEDAPNIATNKSIKTLCN